jgi:hypothetical protein
MGRMTRKPQPTRETRPQTVPGSNFHTSAAKVTKPTARTMRSKYFMA